MIHRTFLSAVLVLAFLATTPAVAAPAWDAAPEAGCFGTIVQGWIDALADRVAGLMPGRTGGESAAGTDPDGTTELRPAIVGGGLHADSAELRPAIVGGGLRSDSAQLRPAIVGGGLHAEPGEQGSTGTGGSDR